LLKKALRNLKLFHGVGWEMDADDARSAQAYGAGRAHAMCPYR